MSVSVTPNVRRLAQYRPFEHGGLDLRAVLHDLVLAVAAINDGSIDSLLGCRQAFADLWSLEVEIDELRPVIDAMVVAGDADRDGKAIRLTSAVLADLQAKARQWQEIEERAFRDWHLEVRESQPALTEEEMSVLEDDLRQWLRLIISRHGAEAALMLYPEDDRARRFFDEVDARGFEALPERDQELTTLRAEALPSFIRCPTPDQRRFLAWLLNTSFYMTVLTIDPEAGALVQAQMSGHRIYLDTNFLYAVLGAAPAEEVYSSRRLVQMSRELGFEFAVTPWTMNELRTSISATRRDIEAQMKFVRPELADAMLRASGDKGFRRLFWQTYRDKKTQPKDVFDRLDHFDKELGSYGIAELTEGCTAVEQQEERIKLYASLVGAERWPYQKEPVVLEHDAKCRLLVERLRGDGNLSLSNARFWFLTYDTKLPRFAKRVPDNGEAVPELPFCVSPSAWVQIIRALTPRTDDFDRTVVDLLTSPYVGYRRAVNPVVVEEVVGRMDHFEDASPEMAIAVLTDTAAVSEIEQAVKTADADVVEDAVVGAYSSKAKELQDAVAASERRMTEMSDALAQAEARIDEIAVERSAQQMAADVAAAEERARVRAIQAKQADERDRWRNQEEALKQDVARAEADRSLANTRASEAQRRIYEMEARLDAADNRRRRARRISLGLFLALIGVAVAVVGALVVVTGAWALGAAVVSGVAMTLLGIRVVVGSKLGGEVALWLGTIAAVAAIVVSIVTDSN